MLNKKLDEMLGEERFEALQELVKKEALKEVNEYDFILLYNAYVKTIQDKSDEAKESVAHIYQLVLSHYSKARDKDEH